MKTVNFIIRAANGHIPNNDNVFAETTIESEAINLLSDAKNQYDYADVLINGKRYSKIN